MESLRCLAVVPVYEYMLGNVCVWYGLKGEVVRRDFSVRTQLRRFFREHGLEEAGYLEKARKILGIRKYVPLAFAADCVLFPVKVRVPIAKGDGALAYVRYEAVRGVEDNRIRFTTGERLDCLQSKKSLEEAMTRAGTMQALVKSEEARLVAERKLIRFEIQQAKRIMEDITKY